MAKKETSLPPAAIKASGEILVPTEMKGTGATVTPMAGAVETAPTSFEDSDVLSVSDMSVKNKRVLQDLYAEYYERGINILKPEIVMTGEFSPIQVLSGRTDDPESTDWDGLRIQAGSKEIPVSQVLRLIELHRSVQDVVNISAVSAIDSSAGFSTEHTLNKIKSHYTDTVLRSTLSQSVMAFLTHLTTSVSDAEDSAFAIWGTMSPETMEYKSFKILVEIVILEQIQFGICEYFSKIVDLRRKIYNLIDFRVSETSLYQADQVDALLADNVISYLADEEAVKYFTILNEGVKRVSESNVFDQVLATEFKVPVIDDGDLTGEVKAADGTATLWSSSFDSQMLTDLLNPEDIAVAGLRLKHFTNSETNVGILYALFHKALSYACIPNSVTRSESSFVQKTLEELRASSEGGNVIGESQSDSGLYVSNMANFLGYGKLKDDRISSVASPLNRMIKPNYYLSSEQLQRFKDQLEIFLSLGTSSFSLGPIARAQGMKADANNYIKLYYYASNHQTKLDTININNVVYDGFFRPKKWYKDPTSASGEISRAVYDINTVGDAAESGAREALIDLATYHEGSKLRSMAELYAISLIDVITDINTKVNFSSEFGTAISLRSSSVSEPDTYLYKILGEQGYNVITLPGGIDFIQKAYAGYDPPNSAMPKTAGFGKIDDVLFGLYNLLSNDEATTAGVAQLGMLPSETIIPSRLPRSLPGHLGIPTEAFVKKNFDNLDNYIGKLTRFTNNLTKDIMGATGIGVSIGENGQYAVNTAQESSSQEGLKSASAIARETLHDLGEALQLDFLDMLDRMDATTMAAAPPPAPSADDPTPAYGDDNTVGLNNNGIRPSADDYDSGLMALPFSLIFAILAGSNNTKHNGTLADYFGLYYYQTIMRQRSQSQMEEVKCKWFTRHSFDLLNSLAWRFATAAGLPVKRPDAAHDENKHYWRISRGDIDDMGEEDWVRYFESLATSTFQNSHYASSNGSQNHRPFYNGQIEQYLVRQTSNLDNSGSPMGVGGTPGFTKGSFIDFNKIDSEKTAYFGPDSTKSLFKDSRDYQTYENAMYTYPQVIGDGLNDTICDIFMPAGLTGNTDKIGSGQGTNGYYFPRTIHDPMTTLKNHVKDVCGTSYMFGRFAGEGPLAGLGSKGASLHREYINRSEIETPWSRVLNRTTAAKGGASKIPGKFDPTAHGINPAEDIARTTGPFRTTEIQRDFATFSMICGVLARCVNVQFSIGKGSTYASFGAFVDRFQIQGVADALKGVTKRTPTALLSGAGTAEGGRLCANGDELAHSELENSAQYQLYIKSYDNCQDAMRDALAPLYDRENSIKICLGAIYQHIAKLNKVKSLISSITNSTTLSDRIKLGLDFTDAIVGEAAEADTADGQMPINNIKAELLRYITPTSTATMYKNAINVGTSSRNRPLFSPIDSFSEEQVHLMTLALSGFKEIGVSKHERMGKKSIVSVGLPSNLIETLRIDALTHGNAADGGTSASDNIEFSNSPYICIHLFKQDALGGVLKYCPKPFLFNTSIIDIENFNSVITDEADHIVSAADISTYSELLEKFTLYRVNYQTGLLEKVNDSAGMRNDTDDLKYMNTGESSSFIHHDYSSVRAVALKEMRENHMLDHYLKMYMRLTSGMDIGEHVFPLKERGNLWYSGPNNRGQGVDMQKLDQYESFRDELFIRYPSINVDADLKSEFGRLESACRRSNYFSSRVRAKNVTSIKSFARVFSMLVNESDFVVYPNSSKLRLAGGAHATLPESERVLIENIQQLYDGGCYFHLGAGRQIQGIHPDAKSSLLFNAFASSEYAAALGHSQIAEMLEDASVRTKSLLRHIEDIESGNVADVYQMFAVVSLVRK